MENPIILIVGVIQYLILSIIVGGIIFNISFQLKKHLIFSLISSLMVYLIRSIFLMLSIPIGVSTLLNMFLTIFIFKYVFFNREALTTVTNYIDITQLQSLLKKMLGVLRNIFIYLQNLFLLYKLSIVSSFIIFIITIINEILTLQPTLNLLKTDVQSVLNNTTLHFEVGMIQNIGLLMIMLIVYIVKKYIVDRRDVFIDN